MAPVLLIDGSSLLYRAFFAVPQEMATKDGRVTNATFGFASMLATLVKDHDPEGIAVAFDRPEPTFRHERCDTYKAGREETPELLIPQFADVCELLTALRVPVIELAGYEADDILATLATRLRDEKRDVIVVSGDRDTYQLVEDPYVRVLYNRRGVSDYVLYDEEGILARTGVRPDQYVDYAAMRGDTSDNLPGVPGVGEKTAAKLLGSYGDLESVLGHAEDQTPKLRANLTEAADIARENRVLMQLLRDAPLGDVDLSRKPLDPRHAEALFERFEFRNLWRRFRTVWKSAETGDAVGQESAEAAVANVSSNVTVRAIDLASRIDECTKLGENEVAVDLYWSTEPGASTLTLAILTSRGVQEPVLLENPRIEELEAALRSGYVIHDAKPLLRLGLREGREFPLPQLDTALATYLLDASGAQRTERDVAELWGKVHRSKRQDPQLSLGLEDDGAPDGSLVCGIDVAATELAEEMKAQGVWDLWWALERPLIAVLAAMEHVGIAVDEARLRQLSQSLSERAKTAEVRVHELAGEHFNVNSTPQLRTILYDKLGLAPGRKTKTGYSTNAQTLEKLRNEHPIVPAILAYRELEKLRNTYGESLLHEVQADGRIHATFQQTVARTGRLSSERPNLHNIPVRTEEGRLFREVFVAGPGKSLLVADYNQIELRIIAHLSGDPSLTAAFCDHRDIHTETAARVFGVAPEDVTRDMRSKAKMVSYGLAYGMEAFGLSQRLNVTRGEAAEILEAYFSAFSSVREYMDRTVAEARRTGYTVTEFGRRRPIPELQSGSVRDRMAGERQAMNAGIQGLAADIFKRALIRIDTALRTLPAHQESQLVLQVHDEVLVEVPSQEVVAVRKVVEEAMVGAAELTVPLEVHVASGHSWADAKE